MVKAAGYIIDFNLYTVGGLDGGHIQMVGFDIGPAQGPGIREPQAGKTAEDEYVANGLERRVNLFYLSYID